MEHFLVSFNNCGAGRLGFSMKIIARTVVGPKPMILMCCILVAVLYHKPCLLHQGSKRKTTGDIDITVAATGTGTPDVEMDQVFTMLFVEVPG